MRGLAEALARGPRQALDSKSEQVVQEALDRLVSGGAGAGDAGGGGDGAWSGHRRTTIIVITPRIRARRSAAAVAPRGDEDRRDSLGESRP